MVSPELKELGMVSPELSEAGCLKIEQKAPQILDFRTEDQ
jgi:hypothetical protein